MYPAALLTLLLALTASAAAQAQKPSAPLLPSYQENEQAIVWVSGPARPGDSVVVTGAFSATPKRIRIARLGSSGTAWQKAVDQSTEIVSAESADSEAISFVIPAKESDGVYAIRIEDDGGARLYARVNLPEIEWITGLPSSQNLTRPDAQVLPGAAPEGGTLRIFGRCFGEDPVVVMSSASAKPVPLKIVQHGRWSISAALPAPLRAGTYGISVQAQKGQAETGGNSVNVKVYPYQPAKPRILNVRSCGAIGDGKADDTKAIQSCLNQGGVLTPYAVLQFPAGKYRISAPLVIPRHVYLAGTSAQEVSIVAGGAKTPLRWISGDSYFGLSNMTVVAEDPKQMIGSSETDDSSATGHVVLDHVIVQANASAQVTGVPLLTLKADQARELVAIGRQKRNTVDLSGPDIRILSTTIRSNAYSLSLYRVKGGILANDAIYNGRYGYYALGNCENLIIEDNRFSGTEPMTSGGAYFSTPGGGVSQNIYTAENTYDHLPANDGEAVTTDGPNGAYFGRLASASGVHLVLAGDPNWNKQDWRNASVAIIGGRGAGQYRLIQSFTGRKIGLEGPFDISPDSSSIITVVATQRHLIFQGNRITDTGNGIGLYGTAYESVIAENTLSRAGGIYLHAAKYGGIQPNLFIQVLDNRLVRRGSFKQGLSGVWINDLEVIQIQCFPPALTLGLVVRGNSLSTEAAVRLQNPGSGAHGVIIEQNQCANPKTQITVQATNSSIVVRR